MEQVIIINEEILEKARAYVPIAEKMQFINSCAQLCFDLMELSAGGAEETIALPPMYKENTFLTERYLTAAFVRLYLNMGYERVDGERYIDLEKEWLISEGDFDLVGRSHFFNQMERAKKEFPQYKNKIFDMIADYKKLEKRFLSEVNALKSIKNDPLARFILSVQMTTQPEHMKEAAEKLEGLQDALEDFKENSAFFGDGGGGDE